VHLHGDGAATFGRLAGWLARVPAVVHYHDTGEGLPWFVRVLDACLAPLTARAVAISEAVAEACVRLRGISRSRVVIVPNAIEPGWAQVLPAEAREVLRQQLGIPANAPVVGTVTRFQPVKGVSLFLEAVARLRAQHPLLHAVIVGDGPERAAMEARLAALGLQACVHLVGHQQDVRPYLSLMDAALFTSSSEGFCLALLEAMAMGRACIATRVG
jgi:glycosyltransferase involved in cell wall biosynthesis